MKTKYKKLDIISFLIYYIVKGVCNINIWNINTVCICVIWWKLCLVTNRNVTYIWEHVKIYIKSYQKLHVWIYTCNKRDIVGIKWPISLGNSHRTFSQFVIYTGPPKDLIPVIILMFSLGNKVQTEKYLVASYTCG